MSKEAPNSPQQSLVLTAYSGETVGRIDWFGEGRVAAEAVSTNLQLELDSLVERLRWEKLRLSHAFNYRDGDVEVRTHYVTEPDMTDPHFMWAIQENLHRFPLAGGPVVGLFTKSLQLP